jgi:hypothetical protein
MRDNWFSNRIFKSYDDLVNHCCAACNKLVEQLWRIMSLGLRQGHMGFDQWDVVWMVEQSELADQRLLAPEQGSSAIRRR